MIQTTITVIAYMLLIGVVTSVSMAIVYKATRRNTPIHWIYTRDMQIRKRGKAA
jgi:hypothetical protein